MKLKDFIEEMEDLRRKCGDDCEVHLSDEKVKYTEDYVPVLEVNNEMVLVKKFRCEDLI